MALVLAPLLLASVVSVAPGDLHGDAGPRVVAQLAGGGGRGESQRPAALLLLRELLADPSGVEPHLPITCPLRDTATSRSIVIKTDDNDRGAGHGAEGTFIRPDESAELSKILGQLHFDNGGVLEPVHAEQRFVKQPQCNMYWEPANISTTLWAWTDQWFSPFLYSKGQSMSRMRGLSEPGPASAANPAAGA